MNSKYLLLGPAILIDLGCIEVIVGILAVLASNTQTIVEYGFHEAYLSSGAMAFGFGIATIILATPLFFMGICCELSGVDVLS